MKYILLTLLLLSNVKGSSFPNTNNFSGKIGVYAAIVNTSSNTYFPEKEICINDTELFPLASAFKTFVLLEVIKKIDAGQLDWKQKIHILAKDESLDSKKYRGKKPLKSFIKKMIKISDNTAADICFKSAGIILPTVTLSNLGLSNARITMPTREYWLALSGLVTNFPYDDLPAAALNYAAMTSDEQVKFVEDVREGGAEFSLEQIENATEDFYSFKTYDKNQTFEILDNIDNAISAKDMVVYLHYFFFKNGLSEKWNKKLRKIMSKGDKRMDKKQIKVKLKYWGGKGGSDLGILTAAGYGETKNGNHILYAVFGSHIINEDADTETINSMLEWIFATLDG